MKKMSTMRRKILDFITLSTEQNGYPPTVREICEAVGLRSPSTVHSHLKILQESGFLEKDDRKTRAISVAQEHAPAKFRSVPLLGTVTAGQPILAQQEMLGAVPYEGSEQGELFALTVRGDSMIDAAILDGDVVIIRTQSTAVNGQIVVAMIDDEATVKRLYIDGRGTLWLKPENAAYSPILADQCTILGLVVALYRNNI